MNKLVFIVGLQKSGTSLLVHLLEDLGFGVSHSGKTEDNEFWGNRPSFAPTAWPAGDIYQATGGNNGHEIGRRDASRDVIEQLRERMAERRARQARQKVVFGKSPYNTVRIPWIRAIFPDCIIVALVRRPLPNVYSLWKRFHFVAGRKPPEDGWWGVKPKGWQTLVQEDKVIQSALQWNAVNAKLWQDRELVDLFVPYHELSVAPAKFIAAVVKLAKGGVQNDFSAVADLRCFDDEYKRGSCLQSKNKFRTGTLYPGDGKVELAPFTDEQVSAIEDICRCTLTRIELASSQQAANI
jgi:hypothetical protein